MLAVVGIVGLGWWLLQILMSVTAILPLDYSTPAIVVADKRTIIVVPARRPTQLECPSCGVVVSMRLVTAADDAVTRTTVGNAVVGGMIGSLLGGARGQELFSWLGAIAAMRNGGGLQPGMRYETTIRLDNGASRVFADIARPQWRDGDRVRVVEGTIRAFSQEDATLKAEATLSRLE